MALVATLCVSVFESILFVSFTFAMVIYIRLIDINLKKSNAKGQAIERSHKFWRHFLLFRRHFGAHLSSERQRQRKFWNGMENLSLRYLE